MSKIKVNRVVNATDDGGPILQLGATIPSSYYLNVQDGVSVSGIATATTFKGDGSLLSNMPNLTASRIFALRQLTKFDEYRC